jgi:hypothetical protein
MTLEECIAEWRGYDRARLLSILEDMLDGGLPMPSGITQIGMPVEFLKIIVEKLREDGW